MTRQLIRLALTAGAFYFLFPIIPGATFHGNFAHAILAGIFFSIFGWVTELLVMAICAALTIGTFGMALFVIVPAWLFGFWLLPALVLRMVADFMPAVLSFTGWMPAIWGGLIMLFVGAVTAGDIHIWSIKNNRPGAIV